MALLSAQSMPVDGFAPSLVAADSAGDSTVPGAGVFVVVDNASASSVTVDFKVPVGAHVAAEVAVAVAAGAQSWVPVPSRNIDDYGSFTYSQTATNDASWTYSATASVTVGVVKAQ